MRHRVYDHRHLSPKSKICSLQREGSLQRCCCWTSGAEGKRATGLGTLLRWHHRYVHLNQETLHVSVHACMQQKLGISRVQGEVNELTILTWRAEAIILYPLIDMWSLPCKYHFSSSLVGNRFHSHDQDLIHYNKSLFTYRKSNTWTLITNAKSQRSFVHDGRAAANRNPGPSLTSRGLKCCFPRISIQLI